MSLPRPKLEGRPVIDAIVRDHQTSAPLFNGRPMPFLQLPSPGDGIAMPGGSVATVVVTVFGWMPNGAAGAEVRVRP